MKKILLALFIASASLLSFSSCTKEYITNYLPGTSYVYERTSSQWVQSGNEPSVFYLDFNISQLDNRVFQDGHVSVSISVDSDPSVYEIVPAVIGDYNYTANYAVGSVRVYAEFIGSGTILRPEGAVIKIVLTDAEIGN